MKAGRKKKLLIGLSVVVVLIAALAIFCIYGVQKYFDNNTWATVRVTGTVERDTADAFEEEHEYLQGDTIVFEGVSLQITDISHSGEVEFKVKHGELYAEDGSAVTEGTLMPDRSSSYRIYHGSVVLTVTQHRYA